ncbi:EAL domain-containing protein, partial [Oleiphilus sp. HI0117]
VLMNNQQFVKDALRALNHLDVRISMDDFGTGYSSLSYLRNYPFDMLKVDRSFVNDLVEDQADKELINAAISMAHSLNLKVVAEGVENQEQYKLLKDLNCDYAQGYLFGRPMAPDIFARHLESTLED